MLSMFDSLMSHSVDVIKMDQDGYGDWVEVSRTTEQGFVQYDRNRTINDEGESIMTDAIAFLRAESSFDPTHDRWDIIHNKNGHRMKVKGFEVIDDPRNGNTHHYELYLL